MTYLELLKVAWLIIWRMQLMGGAFIGIPALMMFNFGSSETLLGIVPLLGSAIFIFLIGPLTIRMALQKQFQGFRLQVVRDSN